MSIAWSVQTKEASARRDRRKKSRAAISMGILCAAWIIPGYVAGQSRTVARGSEVKTSETPSFIEIGPSIPLPMKGVPQQIFAYSVPGDPSGRLLACASEVDGTDARFSSAVYASLDGGNTWMQTLLDVHSDWVSETTCAVGTKGRAYFAAGVSNTSAGALDHSSGSAELYRSSDGGLTWSEARRYPFIDWMQLAASDEGSGDGVYLFANMQAAGIGDAGQGAWTEKRRPMWKSEDGLALSAPAFPAGIDVNNRDQGFPIGAAIDGGQALALFAEIPSHTFVIYEADGDGYRRLSTIKMPPGTEPYSSLSAQLAFDNVRRRLFVAIPALEQGHPALVLARSEDGAASWRSTVLIRETYPMPRDEQIYMYAGVAVNRDGVVGVEWFPGQGCPVFAISSDSGSSIAASRPLGACANNNASAVRFAMDTNLNTYNDRSPIEHPLAYSRLALPGFTVRSAANMLGSVHIAADSTGRFHTFWTEPRWDGIRTFTATASIGRVEAQKVRLTEREEITSESVVRVSNAKFDPSDATFNMEISVRNIGSVATAYPLWLEAFADRSDCGAVRYLNAPALSEAGHPVFKIPQRPDRRRLFPGEDSLILHLLLSVEGCGRDSVSTAQSARQNAMKVRSFFPVAVRFHVYGPPR